MTIKMWKRANDVSAVNAIAGAPKEQDQPIPVPKKTKLYVEQLQVRYSTS